MQRVPVRGNRKRKVDPDNVRSIYAEGIWTKTALARHLGVSVSVVRAILNGTGFYKSYEQRAREEANKQYEERRKRGSGLQVFW